MRVLAIETSGRVGSVALIDAADGVATVLAERQLPTGQRSARTLLPSIDEMLCELSWSPRSLELIATTIGPGSFTGLRIGVVAAKTLAYATGARLVGVHTLAAIAAGVDLQRPRLWTALDAQRQELFVASFVADCPIVDQANPATDILGVDPWIARLAPGDAVAGPPLVKLIDCLPSGVIAIDAAWWSPTAAAVGRLGVELFRRGHAVEPLALVPNYFRKSAAEEKAPR